MANFLSGFLDNLGSGLTNPKGNLGDFNHASQLYTSNSFRLAPKTKFLYHVVFNFHPNALSKALSFKMQHQTTVGMLVKQVDLPKFKISVDQAHQYNRKKQIQTKLEYDPINIQFHDDNLGVTTQLWSTYYGYYYADSKYGGSSGALGGAGGLAGFVSNLVPGVGKIMGLASSVVGSTPTTIPAYQRNSYKGEKFNKNSYGLDNSSSAPFFTSIQIFQMSRHQYQSFTLVNPIITSWQHDTMDNSSSDTVTNTMQIAYEAVIYGQGSVGMGSPKGFGSEYYDKSPSPLSLLGGGKVGLFGAGGVLDGATDVLGGLLSGKAFSSPGAFLGTVIKGANTLKNAKKLSKEGLRQEGFNLITGALTAATGVNVNGVANVFFPKSGGTGQSQSTAATLTNQTRSNGPLPIAKVQSFFNARPGALTSLAKSTIFQKEIGVGNLTEINSRWNALTPAAKAAYESKALDAVANGAPEVQSQYNLIKRQG